MTHEQKPESAEFRVREAQKTALAEALEDGMSRSAAAEEAERHIAEVEARGAAEQRRKDAEGAEIAGYIPADTRNFFAVSEAKYASTAMHRKPFPNDVPVYYCPANVAALEARVKELEGEAARLKKPEFYAVSDLEDSWLSTEELMDSLDGDIPHFETVEIDCFRRVSRIWAFYDGKEVREFADKKEAEFAAAATIREGGEHV